MNDQLWMTGRHRLVAVLALSVTCMLLAGCGGVDDIGLAKAYGTVTLDGQPLANAQLTFESENQGPVTGMTDENGAYYMEFSSSRRLRLKQKLPLRKVYPEGQLLILNAAVPPVPPA